MRRVVWLLASLFVAVGFLWGTWRVIALERAELDLWTEPTLLVPTPDAETDELAPHRELGRVALAAGETVTVEVCSDDRMEPARWVESGVDLALWIPAAQKVVARRRLNADGLSDVERGETGACVLLARGGDLVEGGEYAVEAIWSGVELDRAQRDVPFRVHVMAYRPSSLSERWTVVLVLAGMLLFIVLLATSPRRRRTGVTDDQEGDLSPDAERGDEDADAPGDAEALEPRPRAVARVVVGIATLYVASYAVGEIPFGGALLRAMTLVAVQIAVVVLLLPAIGPARAAAASTLGLGPAKQGWPAFLVAAVAGVALWLLGRELLEWVPATGQSEIGAVVAWPSGSLAVALASVASPLVEELFFRGFVYGSLEKRKGRWVAFVVTCLVFAVPHLPQTWGAWGGFVAVTLTGVGLTALRTWSGSVTVAALAHLVHNSAITVLWVVLAQS